MRRIHALPFSAFAILVTAFAGCSSPDSIEGSAAQQIKGAGVSGATYPEAVLIDARNTADKKHTWKCSGTVIAPKVVLTSGICAGSHISWTVTAPTGKKQTATSTSAVAYKWSRNAKGHTDVKAHNIGLIFLDDPINLAEYPVLSTTAIKTTDKAVAIGRSNEKTVSDTQIFVSDPLLLRASTSSDFPFDYTGSHIVDPGDSGGAQELVGSKPHTIVSVTSKIAGAQDTFSRVDLADVADWIQAQVEAHGGFAAADSGAGLGKPVTAKDAGSPGTAIDAGSGTPDASSSAPEAGPTGPSAAEQACLDTATAVAINAADCGQDYATEYKGFIDAAAGGDCKNITSVRDSASLYNTCLPSLDNILCSDLIAGNLDASCSGQLIR